MIGKRLLSGEPLRDLVTEYPEILPDYKKIKQSYDAYTLDSLQPEKSEGTKGLWIHGPKGTGKSYASRQISQNQYQEDPFIMTGDKWMDGYKGEKVIVIEDLDLTTSHNLFHSLKLWAD